LDDFGEIIVDTGPLVALLVRTVRPEVTDLLVHYLVK